ncbi:MAG: hypothetical protein ABIP38_12170 [Steroidobacteraceae bacterium]
MTTRRAFLQATACAAALPVSMQGLTAPAGSAQGAPRFRAVVVGSHPAATVFGKHFAARGIPVHTLAEDEITSLWLGTIRPLWQQSPVAIAGVTRPATLFCLEQLAWSHGLRVAFHAEHVVHAGSTVHQLQRGAAAAGITDADLARSGADWPTRLAQAMASHRRNRWDPRFGPSLASLEPALPPEAHLLTSWVIAPA